MKINMGENIRKYRRNMDLTQEQLAEMLETSVQSVSRWECGTTYPDMEMLPTIAGIFGVTVNDLFYCSEEQREKFCDELYCQLEEAAGEANAKKTAAVLREIRRNFAEYHNYWIWEIYHVIYKNHLEKSNEVMEQLRELTKDVMRFCPSLAHPEAIEWMAIMEDDNHIQAFLDEYSSSENISRTHLLLRRYRQTNDREKHEPLRKIRLFESLYEVLDIPANWATSPYEDPTYAVWYLKNNLAYLHSICDCTPDPKHPLTGDGRLDLFCDLRLDIGWMLTWALTEEGSIDEACTVMEDLVSLLEKITAIKADKFTLSVSSPAFKDFAADAWFEWADSDDGLQHRDLYWEINGMRFAVIPNSYPIVFDICNNRLQSDSRFGGYMQRIRNCIQTRPMPE